MATTAVLVAVGHIMGLTITEGFHEGSNAELTKPDITSQEPTEAQVVKQNSVEFLRLNHFWSMSKSSNTKVCEDCNEEATTTNGSI